MKRSAQPVEAADVVMGEEYTDSITGIKGVAIAVYTFLTGCDQVCLSFVVGGENKLHTVDASRLKELAPKKARKGGPAGAPSPGSRAVGARS